MRIYISSKSNNDLRVKTQMKCHSVRKDTASRNSNKTLKKKKHKEKKQHQHRPANQNATDAQIERKYNEVKALRFHTYKFRIVTHRFRVREMFAFTLSLSLPIQLAVRISMSQNWLITIFRCKVNRLKSASQTTQHKREIIW